MRFKYEVDIRKIIEEIDKLYREAASLPSKNTQDKIECWRKLLDAIIEDNKTKEKTKEYLNLRFLFAVHFIDKNSYERMRKLEKELGLKVTELEVD